MLVAVLSGFLAGVLAPLLQQRLPERTNWLLALLPAGLVVYFLGFIGPVSSGETLRFVYPWIPSLDVHLSFQVDGLALLFALLISGIGTFILIYAGGYLHGHPHLGRIYAYLLIFMGSMLGLVLSDNLITLFVFWELTSLSSYLLIGFDHHRERARYAALQALLVTALGGLAMLAGLILMALVGGSFELSVLAGEADRLRAHALYPAILILLLTGAFTKSAQVPFHFWLPNAMEAPTPVSAYLHSATMVKAGVYLLARVNPMLGETELWHLLVTGFGAATMLTGAWLAYRQTEFKRILAYTTVSALGTLTMLIGMGTPIALKAAVVFLLVHSLYKGALFLMAGAVDHETGTKDVEKLGGLRRYMPWTAAAGGLAALSMAGVAPLIGFISKELFYEATLEAGGRAVLLTGLALTANILVVAAAGMVAFRPFFGSAVKTPKKPHEAPLSMVVGPAVLALCGLIFGLFPALVSGSIVAPTTASLLGRPIEVDLYLWHGFNLMLLLSVVTLAVGVAAYAFRLPVRRRTSVWELLERMGPERGYDVSLDGLNLVARVQTRVLQNGYLRFYLMTIVLTLVALSVYVLYSHEAVVWDGLDVSDTVFYEAALCVLIMAAAAAAVFSRSRLGAVAALGGVGFGVALIFILFSAPDLAMTQFLVETLTVILLVLVFYHLPRFTVMSKLGSRLRDGVVALTAGGLVTGLILMADRVRVDAPVSEYFIRMSVPEAHGRNIVNVILVDFRAIDTLGEIVVLAIAGVGVYALLKLKLGEKGGEGKS